MGLQTSMFIDAYYNGRSEKNFPDPLAFKPERWLEGEQEFNTYATQGFGFGIRNCVGKFYIFINQSESYRMSIIRKTHP